MWLSFFPSCCLLACQDFFFFVLSLSERETLAWEEGGDRFWGAKRGTWEIVCSIRSRGTGTGTGKSRTFDAAIRKLEDKGFKKKEN